MSRITVELPSDGVAVLYKRSKRDPNQTSLFETVKEIWFNEHMALIKSLPTPIRMSDIRVAAYKAGLSAPAECNWYGSLAQKMRAIGFRKISTGVSTLESRSGGTEGVWDLV